MPTAYSRVDMSDFSVLDVTLGVVFCALTLIVVSIIVIGVIRLLRTTSGAKRDPPSAALGSAPDVSRDGS